MGHGISTAGQVVEPGDAKHGTPSPSSQQSHKPHIAAGGAVVGGVEVVFKKGPDPKPQEREGWTCKSCWAMGTNPNCDPNANDLPDTGKLATWQKVVLGAVSVVAAAVAAAPVAAVAAPGCLAAAPVCAAEIVEAATGGASGGSITIVGAAAGGSLKSVNAAEHGTPRN